MIYMEIYLLKCEQILYDKKFWTDLRFSKDFIFKLPLTGIQVEIPFRLFEKDLTYLFHQLIREGYITPRIGTGRRPLLLYTIFDQIPRVPHGFESPSSAGSNKRSSEEIDDLNGSNSSQEDFLLGLLRL